MPESMSATWLWPAARRPASIWAWVSPAGNCLPTRPSKRMFVALPSSFGPSTLPATLTIAERDHEQDAPRARARARRRDGAGCRGSRCALLGGHHAICRGLRTCRPPIRARAVDLGAPPPAPLMPPPPRGAGRRRSRGRSRRSRAARVRAHPHDRAGLQDHDLVGVHDRAHALGDDEHGRVAGLVAQRRAEPGVGREVEGREAVVEDVDRRPRTIARAMASRWRCPPETLLPPWAIGASSSPGMLGHEVARLGHRRGRATAPRRSPLARRSAGCWRPCR